MKLGKSEPLAGADIAAIAAVADIELMIGYMLESAVQIYTSAYLVWGLGSFDYDDLDSNPSSSGTSPRPKTGRSTISRGRDTESFPTSAELSEGRQPC